MKRIFKFKVLYLLMAGLLIGNSLMAQQSDLRKAFHSPSQSAKPWVFWYWMHAAITKEGIKADLEAMKDAGIGGVYLVPIKGADNPPLLSPPVETLTPQWWEMLRYAFQEADRQGIQIAMHASDGFATAGGPWITPERSMQKVVWSEIQASGNKQLNLTMPKPESYKDYYRDIAILAFPAEPEITTSDVKPEITTSVPDANVSFLADDNSKANFKSTQACWIQYAFDKPFTCRSIHIRTNGTNFQAHRLLIKVSDDGLNFRTVTRLVPYRHGWSDFDQDVTHSITTTTARYFRFYYDKEGTEPAAEDLDNAKWNPYLRVKSICLSSASKINQYEGKNGLVWRLGLPVTEQVVPDSLCISLNKIINLTSKLDSAGHLQWQVPPGNWTILRIGCTSTGHENNTGGAGKGLECDKLNPEAVKLQFDHWFGETMQKMGPELTSKVLKIFHVDSWECGSQNWSPVFRNEFRKRRGYDLENYLPVFAGVPVESAEASERFLHDVRQTISELMVDNFYGTLKELAHQHGLLFTGECVAPVMMSDGMVPFRETDIPMGEFWLNSPSHDKPNDMMDAVSAAHVYGKPLVQAEAFTTLRTNWNEYPGMLKTLEDRNFALGINRLVQHVYVLNPWIDRKPGMTMDGVGLYFQRDQTWWKPGFAWVDYTTRCQSVLQQGTHVADIAIFTGEELPSRALLPDRLVSALPGIFGEERVKSEAERLKNTGVPTRKASEIVSITSNMAEPQDWVNPLRGYAYDAINPDALLRLAKVENGRIVLPGGASYGVLVIPGVHPMHPDAKAMSAEVAEKLNDLVKDGATVVMNDQPDHSLSLFRSKEEDAKVQQIMNELFHGQPTDGSHVWNYGKGKVIKGSFRAQTFDGIGISRDMDVHDSAGNYAKDIAWTHRTSPYFDIYFISNQRNQKRDLNFSFRTIGKIPEKWNPVNGETKTLHQWQMKDGRTVFPLSLEANASVFIVFQKTSTTTQSKGRNNDNFMEVQNIIGPWKVKFDPAYGGPAQPVVFKQLLDWSKDSISGIRYYSGTAIYSNTFVWKEDKSESQVWIDLGTISNLAEVKVNGMSCGVAWTAPYRVNISKALMKGRNDLIVEVTNTWANRLIGDHSLPERERITHTNAPFLLESKPLNKAGLFGPVKILISNE